MIAVLDANVLVAGIGANRTTVGKPGQIFARLLHGDFVLVSSPYILHDVERALSNKRYFRPLLDDEQRVAAMSGLWEICRMVDPVVAPGVAPHRHDDPVLATVAVSGADWFVTGDEALLALGSYCGVPFADPADFLAALDEAAG